VSEQILNGTSAQLGYAGKYRTEDKLKTDTLQKLKTNQKNQTTQKTQQNKTSLVQSLLTALGQETRWAYIGLVHTGRTGRLRLVNSFVAIKSCTL